MHDPNTAVFGHSLPDLDEDDELITSTSLAELRPSNRDSADEHIDSFREKYANFRQTHDLPPNDNMQIKRGCMQQHIDFAVQRALERQPLLATIPSQGGHGFGILGADAPDLKDRSDNDIILAEAIAAVEKLASRVTTPIKSPGPSLTLRHVTPPQPKPPDIATSTLNQTLLSVPQA